MERVWLLRVAIREREVDGDSEADLATAKNVLEEGVPLLDLEVRQSQHVSTCKRSHLLVRDLVLGVVLFELAEGERCLSDVLVLAGLLGDVKVYAHLPFYVISGQVRR